MIQQVLQQRRTVVDALFTAPHIEALFSEDFLRVKSVASVESQKQYFLQRLGPYQHAEEQVALPHQLGTTVRAVFEQGIVPVVINTDANQQIIDLHFNSSVPRVAGLEALVQAFAELPGEVSLCVQHNGRPLADLQADRLMPVASAFKLDLLRLCEQAETEGRICKHDVFPLPTLLRSLPSGVLQDWPAGSLLTFDTLQALMVSRSDNTATNLIIEVLGRDFLEEHLLNQPLVLNLNELFYLKQHLSDEAWQGADLQQKREFLHEAQQELAHNWDLHLGSIRISHGIGYHYSTRQLCDLIQALQHSPYLSINTGPAVLDSQHWQRVAYKGGEESGIFNLTALVQNQRGDTYTASATWNRKQALHVGLFKALFKGIFVFLEGHQPSVRAALN